MVTCVYGGDRFCFLLQRCLFFGGFFFVGGSSECLSLIRPTFETHNNNKIKGVDDDDEDVPLVCDHSGIGTGIPPRRLRLPRPILPSLFIIVVVPSS